MGGADAAHSVMIVDDHRLFRQGLRDLLRESGFKVTGEAENAADAVALAAETKPDVALMDINMPGSSGIDATRRLGLVSPATRVVMLTVSPDEGDVAAAVAAGACGYLLKDASVQDVASSVRAAAAGESLLSPRIAADLLARMREAPPPQEVPEEERPQLTEREQETLRMIVEGKGNAEIAEELVISEQTVKNHVSSVLAKLEVDNRIQAAVYAVRERLV
jgi:DNA-binding NarL/FixJ family response regulator